MGLFEQLGMQSPQQRQDPRDIQRQRQQSLNKIKSGPQAYLKSMGYSIPDGMTDARQITQYLLQTQQIGIPRLRQVFSRFGGK